MSLVAHLDLPRHAGQARRGAGAPLVLSPSESLLEGGATEQLERSIQQLLSDGYRRLVVDLASVSRIDGGGVRALVRGYATAHRVGASLQAGTRE